jgi:hypothetical protein
LLTPYDAAFYWYAFRHSIARNGNPHLRLGKALRRGVVRSSSSKLSENTISEQKFREVLRALESIGAIRKEGEPTRDGTLYRVFVPDESKLVENTEPNEQRQSQRRKFLKETSIFTTWGRTESRSMSETATNAGTATSN